MRLVENVIRWIRNELENDITTFILSIVGKFEPIKNICDFEFQLRNDCRRLFILYIDIEKTTKKYEISFTYCFSFYLFHDYMLFFCFLTLYQTCLIIILQIHAISLKLVKHVSASELDSINCRARIFGLVSRLNWVSFVNEERGRAISEACPLP